MAQRLQVTLDTILEKVAILEGRFDKLLTQSLCQLSETAHAKEGEINVELTRRAETVAQAVLCLDQKIGSLEQIYPIYAACAEDSKNVGFQSGSANQAQGVVLQQMGEALKEGHALQEQVQQLQRGQAGLFQQEPEQQGKVQQGPVQGQQQVQVEQVQVHQVHQVQAQQGQMMQVHVQQEQTQQFKPGQAQQGQVLQGQMQQGQMQQGQIHQGQMQQGQIQHGQMEQGQMQQGQMQQQFQQEQGKVQQFQQGQVQHGQVQQVQGGQQHGPAQGFQQGQSIKHGQHMQQVSVSGGETVIVTEESSSVSSVPQQQAQQGTQDQQQAQQGTQVQQQIQSAKKVAKKEEVAASGFPKLEETREKLLKEIKRVVAGPNGERKVITYSQEEAAKLAEAGEELIGEELTEEEAELFYQEMLAEAEAEMLALESSIDTYSDMTVKEEPPEKLFDFANEAIDFLDMLMRKLTGIASDVARPPPKFAVSDEQFLKLMEERVAAERKEREEQRARDKKARRVGFGDNVDVREFVGEDAATAADDDDDVGSDAGSEFSDSSEGSSMISEGSSMYSESMASEIPEGWEWSEEHQDYIFVGGDAGSLKVPGEEGGKKGTYVYVEGADGAEGQYYFVPEGAGGAEFNQEIAAPPTTKGKKEKDQIPAGAKAVTAEQMAGKMPPGKPVSFLSMQGEKMKKASGDGRDPVGGSSVEASQLTVEGRQVGGQFIAGQKSVGQLKAGARPDEGVSAARGPDGGHSMTGKLPDGGRPTAGKGPDGGQLSAETSRLSAEGKPVGGQLPAGAIPAGGLETASGKVFKGQGGSKPLGGESDTPLGPKSKMAKKPKPKQRADLDEDFPEEDAAFGGVGGGGQKLKFKKKKKKEDDDDDDEAPKIEAPTGTAEGAGGWESEMNKKKNKAKRKKSREDERKKMASAAGGATYDTVKPKLLDKVPWEQPPPGVRPPAPVKNHDVPIPKDSKVLGVRPAIEWILRQPGPFCTTRMVYRNSKKATRPLYVEKAFEDLHNYTLQGLVVGMLFTVKGNTLSNTKCFMKAAPAFVSKRYLREFGIDIETYRESFLQVDDHASRDPYWFDLVDRVKEVHPWISDFPVDVAYGNVAGMTREEMMEALKKRHAEFLEVYEAERLAIKAQLDAKSDVHIDETGKIIVKRKFKGTAPGLPHMPKNSWAED